MVPQNSTLSEGESGISPPGLPAWAIDPPLPGLPGSFRPCFLDGPYSLPRAAGGHFGVRGGTTPTPRRPARGGLAVPG